MILFGVGVAFWFLKRERLVESPSIASLPMAISEGATQRVAQVKSVSGRTPLEAAAKFLESNSNVLNVREYHELKPHVTRTPLGSRVVYDVYQDGVPIVGMQIRLRMNREMEIDEIENGYRALDKVDVDPKLTPSEAFDRVSEGRNFSPTAETFAFAGKIIFVRENAETPELAYVMPVQKCGARASHCQLVIRANDGQLLARSVARAEF